MKTVQVNAHLTEDGFKKFDELRRGTQMSGDVIVETLIEMLYNGGSELQSLFVEQIQEVNKRRFAEKLGNGGLFTPKPTKAETIQEVAHDDTIKLSRRAKAELNSEYGKIGE